ncbi:MAG: hypothetical protein JW999_01250 [Methanotrichaceae archaeon]|nr:hypothetical protein [Methanotrichaceae archaeon]
MRAKAQLGKSDLSINIGRRARRKTSRASFLPRDAANGTTPDVKDVLEVLKAMHVMIPETSEVRGYLFAHPDLSCLIPPICCKLIKTFPEDAKLFLEIYRDPEIHDEYLTLYIRKNVYEEQILDCIDEAMAEFEPVLGSASGWLLVTTDFLLPK